MKFCKSIFLFLDEIEFEIEFFFCENLLVRVKLGHPPNFNFLGKPLLGEKYVHGKKKKEERKKERIMPSLVATTSTPARKPFVRTHYVRTNKHYLLLNIFNILT